MTLVELQKKYPDHVTESLKFNAQHLLSVAALNNDIETCDFLLHETDIDNREYVYTNNAYILGDMARARNLKMLKYFFNKMDEDPEQNEEETLFNKRHYLRPNYNNIIRAIIQNADLEMLKYYLSFQEQGINTEIIPQDFAHFPCSNIRGTLHQELAEFILYETDFKAENQLIKYFEYQPEQNECMLELLRNQQKTIKIKEMKEKLTEDLAIKTTPISSRMKV